MGSKHSYLRADRLRAIEEVIGERLVRITDELKGITDEFVETLIEDKPDDMQKVKLHKIAIKLLDANREWASSLQAPISSVAPPVLCHSCSSQKIFPSFS